MQKWSFRGLGHSLNTKRRNSRAAAGASVARAARSAAQTEILESRVLLSSAIAAFGTQQTFAAVSSPAFATGATVADLNGDGKTDVIVPEGFSTSVAVLLGNGNGTFGAPINVNAGSSPESVIAADVNGDGKLDLVTGDYSNTISVMLGNGNGTFGAPTAFPVDGHTNSIAAADINGDGKVDLVTVNTVSQLPATGIYSMNVLLGHGDGTFAAATTYAPGARPLDVAIADVNRDGKPDVVVANEYGGTVGVFFGNGDGSLGTMQTYAAGVRPSSVSIGDLNGDGAPDVVVTDYDTSTYAKNDVGVLLNNGSGQFLAQQTFAAGTSPKTASVADINGDGKLDVVAANVGSGSISVLLGNGNGTLGAQRTFATGTQPVSPRVADLNNDGRLDVVVANQSDNTVGVFMGDVPPTLLSISRSSPTSTSTTSSSVSFGVTFNEPVTGVDATDFQVVTTGGVTASSPVVVSGTGASYTVTVNGIAGAGTLGLNLVDDGSIVDAAGNPLQPGGVLTYATDQTFTAGDRTTDAAVADVNGDGIPDIIASNFADNTLSVLLGNGNGTYQAPSPFGAGAFPNRVSVADVNGDGKLDLLTAEYGADAIGVLLGNGNGTFATQTTYAVGVYPGYLAVADLNGDGKPDIVASNSGGGSYFISVLINNGNGTFAAQKTYAIGTGPSGVAIADFNRDGRPDIAVADTNQAGNTVSVLFNVGGGNFAAQTTFGVGATQPRSIAAADLNSDGNPDLIVADDSGGSVSVLLSNGNGTFQTAVVYAAGANPYDVSVGDVNGDGKLDVVVANNSPGTVSVLLGNGDGTLQPLSSFAAGTATKSVAIADIDRDGHPDLITSNDQIAGTVGILRAPTNANFTGPTFAIVASTDVINGTANNDTITLKHDATDPNSIDWTITGDPTTHVMAVNDVNGLTVNGLGGADVINLDYSNGNPLPNVVHLNQFQTAAPAGTFTINGLTGTNALSGTTLDINTSKVFLNGGSAAGMAAVDSLVKTYISNGYNAGTWAGTAPAGGGAINSKSAALNPSQFAVGWGDVAAQNAVELMYTVNGDATLDGLVNLADVNAIALNFGGGSGRWDQGDFTHDGLVNLADVNVIALNFGKSLPNGGPSVQPATASAALAPATAPQITTTAGTDGDSVTGNEAAIAASAFVAPQTQPSDSLAAKHSKNRKHRT